MAEINGPLDEVRWEDPSFLQNMGPVTADSIHHYFIFSPFCDPGSNNTNLDVQARNNPDVAAILFDRNAFEAKLNESMGIKYLIEDGPAPGSTSE